jgi:hypothetical protein
MWNWRGTDLCAEWCRCGFIEVKKSRETVAVMQAGETVLFKEGLPTKIKETILDMLIDRKAEEFRG